MIFPAILAEHLRAEEIGPPSLGMFAMHAECAGSKHHSPTPLVLRNFSLDPTGIHRVTAPVVTLCGTCADNVSVLMSLMVHHDGMVPWSVRRDFGNLVRSLATRGWEWYLGSRP